MRNFRSLLVLLALIVAAPAAAQETRPTPGDRLRVYAPTVGPDSLSRAQLERIRIPPRGKRALLGGLAGFAISTAVVVASDPGSWDCEGGEFCGLSQSVLIISGATIAGGIIGYMTR